METIDPQQGPLGPSAEDQLLGSENRVELMKKLHLCPEPQREILYLRIFRGLSYREIGEVFGKTENWARVNYYLACVPKSIFSRHSVNASYECEEEIRQVWLGDRILWSEGEEITTLAASLLEAYNPYIGDMPANNRVARALNISAYTGEFTNELQTAEEPYGWKMILKKDFPESRQEAVEERLTQYAYFCLADIGNLGQVEFVYSLGGQPVSLIVTADQATAYAGADIKAVGRDIKRLNALVEKIGWFW